MSDRRRLFIVVGGPNGTGKSTFSNAYRRRGLQVVDPDEIGRVERLTDGAAWAAGRDRALARLSAGEDVVVESTLAGSNLAEPSTYLKMMSTARELGFRVHLTFVCVENPMALVARIQTRFERGLHTIPEELILRRYEWGLKRLPDTIALADSALIVDNSTVGNEGAYKVALAIDEQRLEYRNPILPGWVSRSLAPQLPEMEAADRERVITEARARVGSTAPVIDAEGDYEARVLAVGATHVALRYGSQIAVAAQFEPTGVKVRDEIRLRAKAGIALDQHLKLGFEDLTWGL